MNAKQKESLKASFGASKDIREKLTEISKDKILVLRAKRISESAYESPNWAYQQADLCGYERALEEIISLLSD